MTEKSTEERLKRLSEAAIFAEPSDPKALADLHTEFEDLGQWAIAAAEEAVAAAAKASAELIEKIILEEVDNPQEAMGIVGRGISAIEALLRDGRGTHEVDFPEELGLGSGSTGAQGRAPDLPPLPPGVDEAIFTEFLERQDFVLDEMERLVMASLEEPGRLESQAELRRLIHTLKGESALLGLGEVEHLCHALEDTLNDRCPQGLVDVLLDVKDWLKRTFDSYSGKGPAPGPAEPLLERFTNTLPPDTQEPAPVAAGAPEISGTPEVPETSSTPGAPDVAPEPAPPPATAEAKPLEGEKALLGEFISEAGEHLESADQHLLTLEADPRHDEALNAVFRAFHTIKGVSGFLALDEIQQLSHEAENLLDKARKGELLLEGEIIDTTFAAVDMLKRLIHNVAVALSTGEALVGEESLPQLLSRIHAASSGEPPPPAAAQPSRPEPREEAVAAEAAKGEDIPGDASSQQSAADGAPSSGQASRRTALKVKEAVRVDADRLDRLVDTIGELVIAESMVSQSIGVMDGAAAGVGRHLSQLDKITRELQEMGMSLRMVPIRATFQKMARLVRDLGKKMGKQVQFVTVGEDTELDKTVVDRIGDPLVHMVRNAVDHGIEATPEARRKAGKPESARVELRAFHKGGNIYIEVADDGRGLNRQVILDKAREKGVIRNGESLSDRDVWNLIFAPGFSTAKQVTDVSGRGVGMDVVKRNIEALRGQVDIRSEWGKGSVFSIRLPLTLAIIDGMVVRVGKERYIIPTLSIVRSIRPEAKDISTVLNHGEMISLEGRLIPLFRLDRLFSTAGEKDATKGVAVVVEDDGRQTALLTDELLGQQQIVIKSLGEAMRDIPGIAGGAIMPDGPVGLILDVSGLVRLANADAGAQSDMEETSAHVVEGGVAVEAAVSAPA